MFMRETFGSLFLIAACALTWTQVSLFAFGNQPERDVIGVLIGLTLISYVFSYVASGTGPNKTIKRILTFIGGGQSLFLVAAMALSITGYAFLISTEGPGYILLFLHVIGFGVYAAVLGGFLQLGD